MLSYLPDGISSFASDIDRHMTLIYWICGIWFVLVEFFLLYCLIAFRKKEGVRAAWLPADTKKSNAWILIPVFFVLIFDLWIEADSASVWAKIKEDVPAEGMQVRVTGRQFGWDFRYPGEDGVLDTADDFVSIGEMHVPVNEVIRFQLESVDVIHAFYVPELRLKQDVVPGRSIPGWFDTNTEGVFTIACAELCGANHTQMYGSLHVQSRQDFDAWAAQQR